MVKIGTTQAQKKLFFKLNQTRRKLQNLTGDDDTSMIAGELEVTDTEVEEMTARLSIRDSSIDVELFEGEDYTLLDRLADDRSNQEDLLLEKEEDSLRSQLIQSAMTTLNDREKKIVRERILADDSRTLQEIADELKISRERVRQIEQNALRKLKDQLAA